MNTNPLKQGAVSKNSAGLGTVTRQMVRERAVELAVIDGRSAQEASKSDWEQAKLELTGDSVSDLHGAVVESVPESEGWELVAGSGGHKVPVTPGEDEDEEGRSDQDRMVKEGIAGAEHDLALEAARAARKSAR